MGNKLRDVFSPSKEKLQEFEDRAYELHKSFSVEKGCITCKHCKHVIDYPGFVTGEECECDVGLECDTVLHSVKYCDQWEDGWQWLAKK